MGAQWVLRACRGLGLSLSVVCGLAGCGEGESGGTLPTPQTDAVFGDAGLGGADAGAGGDVSTGGTDAGAPDAGTADATQPCTYDEICGEGAYCESGACLPAVPPPTLPADGVFRAGASRFDVAPDFFEPWTDRAGAVCPGNRVGRFDIARDATPENARCADVFDDLDGDGHFDAVWMAGGATDRPAMGVDEANPPAGRVLWLQQNSELWLLVTLDVYAIGPEPLRALVHGLHLRTGFPEARIAVHATGVATGPDAVGMWGPSLALAQGPLAELHAMFQEIPLLADVPVEPGLDREWWREVQRRVVVAAGQALATAVPVTLRAARVRLPSSPDAAAPPGSPLDWVGTADEIRARIAEPTSFSHDGRFPPQRDVFLRTLSLTGPAGAPVAVLCDWGALPHARGAADPTLSADLAGLARAGLEAAWPGAVGIWLTGATSAEVEAGGRAVVPEVDPAGEIVGPGPDPDPPAALARLLVHEAQVALAALPDITPVLTVASRYAWLPITNPRYDFAARLGVLSGLSDWLAGRRTTPTWSSGAVTPACGGLGCLRYRLDLVGLGPISLLTTPAGLDGAFVAGRGPGSLTLTDPGSQNLIDLDLDGILDADDPDLTYTARGAPQEVQIRLPGALNPQRFPPVAGLETEALWLVGGTNGGLGSLRTAEETIPVFEGQMAPILDLAARRPDLAELDLCLAGYDCALDGRLSAVVPQVLADLPTALADLPGGHLVTLAGSGPALALTAPRFTLESPDGTVRAELLGLVVGPGPWAFSLSTDFLGVGLQPGDVLRLQEAPPTQAGAQAYGDEDDEPESAFVVTGIAPLVLARHPNAGVAWQDLHSTGGDAVYNTACELIAGGACPHPRPAPPGGDPNATLPRQPEEGPPPPPVPERVPSGLP